MKRIADCPRYSQKRARTERDGQLVKKDNGEDTVVNDRNDDRNVDQSDLFSNPSRAPLQSDPTAPWKHLNGRSRNRIIHKDHGQVAGQLTNDLDAEVGDNMPVSLFYCFMTLIDFRSKTFLILALKIQ